jgi:hypothetical protein
MKSVLDHDQLQARLTRLDPSELGCRAKIAELRRLMDVSCDRKAITMQQWRSLLDKLALVQAQLVPLVGDAWRNPAAS